MWKKEQASNFELKVEAQNDVLGVANPSSTTLGNLALGLSSFSHVPEKSQEGNRHSSPSAATLLREHFWTTP